MLTVVLPPLLYSAALDSSLIAIRRNLRTVVSLSVLLVLVTALLIGVGFGLFVAGRDAGRRDRARCRGGPAGPGGRPRRSAARSGLPPRLITLIQGEGLLNDATALTILAVAVAAARGGGFSAPAAFGQFLLAAVGGVAAGCRRRLRRSGRCAGCAATRCRRTRSRWPRRSSPTCSARRVHVSGVLAVVVAGLIIGHNNPSWASGASRLQTGAVWRLVDFLLEGFVFLLIGQQLPTVIRGLGAYGTSTVVIASAVTVGVVLLLRPLWLWLTEHLPQSLHTRLTDQDSTATATGRARQPRRRCGAGPRLAARSSS